MKIYLDGKLVETVTRRPSKVEVVARKRRVVMRTRKAQRAKYRVGSNQYVVRSRRVEYEANWYKTFLGSIVVLSIFSLGMYQVRKWTTSEITYVFSAEPKMEEPFENLVPEPIVLAAEPTPSPTPEPLKKNVEEIIEEVFGDLGQEVVDEAKLVARCESGMREEAHNGANKDDSRDDGAFQINSVHGINPRFLKDAYVNVTVARQLYDEQGWQPWYSSNHCHHLLD